VTALRRLCGRTTTYFVGNVIYRGASFVLIPLYAHVLTEADYGTLELITTTTFVLQAVLSSGIAHAALRFYFEYDDEAERHAVISTALLANLACAGLVALLVGAWGGAALSRALFGTVSYTLAFRLALAIIVLDISREISLAWVRACERAGLFMIVSVTQLLAQVGFNVYAVVVLHMGVTGILLGTLAATATVWVILTTITLRECGLAFDRAKLWPVLRYGQPLMLSALAASAFQFVDRFCLKSYTSVDTLGAYALALRIANVFPVLFLAPFTNGYGPFRFAIMKEVNAREIYSHVVTYYALGATAVVLAIASCSRDIVGIAASPEFAGAAAIVPWLIVPAALGGITYCLQTGIYVTKHTRYLVYISAMTGAINLGLDLILTPRMGLYGPPVAALITTLYTIVHTFVLAQRVLPVRFEWARLGKIAAAAAIAGGVAATLPAASLVLDIGLKMGAVAAFPVILWVMRFATDEEILELRRLAARMISLVTVATQAFSPLGS